MRLPRNLSGADPLEPGMFPATVLRMFGHEYFVRVRSVEHALPIARRDRQSLASPQRM